jgi:hypothetical protein
MPVDVAAIEQSLKEAQRWPVSTAPVMAHWVRVLLAEVQRLEQENRRLHDASDRQPVER